MALLSKAGSFTRAGAAGNQAITGIGFQPKLVIMFESSGSESAGGVGARFTIGAASGASNRFTVSTRSQDNVGTANTAHIQVSDKVWTEVDSTTTTATNSADFVSMDSDGFTVSWSGAFGGTVEYLALGGSDLDVLVGSFDMNGSTGNQAVTGVGFQPKAVLFFNCIDGTTEGPADNTQLMIGCGVSSTERWAMSYWDDDGAGTMISSDRITNGKCIARYNDSAAVVEADLVSLDSDGFTVNITTALACRMQFIALGGNIEVKAGITQQPAAAGDVSESSFGFQPTCAFFAGVGADTLDTITAAPRPNWGVVDSSLAEIQMALSIRDNHTTSAVRKVITQGNCISKIAIASTTIEAQAQMQSFDSDGMTLNWSVANATQSRHGFLALAAAAAAGSADFAISPALSTSFVGAATAQGSTAIAPSLSAAFTGAALSQADIAILAEASASFTGAAIAEAVADIQATLTTDFVGNALVTIIIAATFTSHTELDFHANGFGLKDIPIQPRREWERQSHRALDWVTGLCMLGWGTVPGENGVFQEGFPENSDAAKESFTEKSGGSGITYSEFTAVAAVYLDSFTPQTPTYTEL